MSFIPAFNDVLTPFYECPCASFLCKYSNQTLPSVNGQNTLKCFNTANSEMKVAVVNVACAEIFNLPISSLNLSIAIPARQNMGAMVTEPASFEKSPMDTQMRTGALCQLI